MATDLTNVQFGPMLKVRQRAGQRNAEAASVERRSSTGPLTVAVCTRDRPDWCARTVKAVLTQLGNADELVVIDQSGSDGTKRVLRELTDGHAVRRVASSQRGLSAARNEAIAAAANETVVFIDDDCIPEAGWLEGWRQAWVSWSDDVGIAFGRVLRATFDPAKGSIAGFEPDPGIYGQELFRRPTGAGGMGANMAIKRPIVRRLSGFDEALGSGAFFGAGEELDLAYRLVRSGGFVAHVEAPVVRHHGFRPHAAGSALTLRYAFGTAAAFAKHARCGDVSAASLLAREIWDSTRYVGSQFVRRRRPLGLRGLISYMRGIAVAFTWPIEAERRLFVPRPEKPVDENPPIVRVPVFAVDGESQVATARRSQLVLFTSSYCMGGIEAHVIDLAQGLIERGWDVALICATLPDIEPLRDEMKRMGARVHAVPQATNPIRMLQRAVQMVRILRGYRGCIVHLHLQGESGGLLSLLAARIAGVKAVIRTQHNPPIPPITRRHRLLIRVTDRMLDRVVYVSPETKRAHEDEFRRNPRKSVIVANGVNLKRFSAQISRDEVRRELGIAPLQPVVGTIARLEETRKGISEFVVMAAAVGRVRPDARFMVVGEGPLRAGLERQAAQLGMRDRFIFTGYRRDVPRLLAAMDIAVFPSSYEAGPYVMLEAMAMARPVVITPTGLAIDLVKPGVTGVLVPFHDPAAVFLAVNHLLDDADLARSIGEAGRQIVLNGYSAEAMVDGIARLYYDVANAGTVTTAVATLGSLRDA